MSEFEPAVPMDRFWGTAAVGAPARPEPSADRYVIGDDGLLVERVGPWEDAIAA
jgi:hypothetical protein